MADKKLEAEKLITQYDERLREVRDMDISEISLEEIEQLCTGFEQEMNTLNSKRAAILSEETRALIRERYLMQIEKYREIVRMLRISDEAINDLSVTNDSIYESVINKASFEAKLSKATQEVDKLNSNIFIGSSLKENITQRYNTEVQRLTRNIIDKDLPVQIKDSIDLIEMTLAEPELYTLPHFVMWKETAEEKIEKIQNQLEPKLPAPIEKEIVRIYESLLKQLKAEILKLRTYPIPEDWCSDAMRKGATHLIEGNFIFFVWPDLMEEMKPLTLTERDLQPGRIPREEYDKRMNRVNMESALAIEELENRNAIEMERKLEWVKSLYATIEEKVNFTYSELALLYRDERTLEFLVNKNEDDKLLKSIYEMLLRNIRHFRNNRIDIPSVAIDSDNSPLEIAPPKEERDIPTASGIDRGASEGFQLVTPAAVIVIRNTIFVADRYGHLVSRYRASDLTPFGFMDRTIADTPVSLVLFNGSLYAAYATELVQYSLSWDDKFSVVKLEFSNFVSIQQLCCTASEGYNLYVGTLKPSLILINTYTLRIVQEYQLNPIRYHNKKRYPWLQDMKAGGSFIFCLFTGSPAALQLFSNKGELLRCILTEDKIVGAYHFHLSLNPVTNKSAVYVTDFWDNSLKVFNLDGELVDTFCEKGFELGQIFHPTGIFVEPSGYITVCDMKEENCLQRL